jgi:type IV pilus assembly protein PilY1
MRLKNRQAAAFALGALWASVSGAPALADDIELFVGATTQALQGRPNILLILDDSGSMAATLQTQAPYNPGSVYSGGGCQRGAVYWNTVATPPACSTDNYFERAGLKCKHALDAFASPSGGSYRDYFASFDDGAQARWEALDTTEHDRAVECAADWGEHGDTTAGGGTFPRNGAVNDLWTSDTAERVQWGASPTETVYTIYDGNWLAWYYAAPTVASTRMAVAKDVAANLVGTISGANVGLMHFTQSQTNGLNGGRVAYAVTNIDSARGGLQSAIAALSASKSTPLSETLYEAALYMMGRSVGYGTQSPQSVAASRQSTDQAKYDSPIDFQCQKTHVIYVTDGEPSGDFEADSSIVALRDANNRSIRDIAGTIAGNQCDLETYPPVNPPWQPEGGECLDELAQFLHDGDMSSLPGQQNVTVHTVGFALGGLDLPILKDTAERGGGNYYDARDTASLTTALSDIVTNILDSQSTFTSPTVSVNTFNRARNLNDLYVTVFEPSSTKHWPGNLKKYQLRPSDGAIIDSRGLPAVNPATGFFFNSTRSLWLDANDPSDGSVVQSGGAAHRIPADRVVYTYLGGVADLTASGNRIRVGNSALTDELLGTGGARPQANQVINFINGVDTADHDKDGSTTEARHQLGDPLHSEAASVVYGPSPNDTTIYFATNDGFLHAVNAATGVERWAFLPPEFLPTQVELFLDAETSAKTYGIDGSLRVQQLGDSDGVVEPGEGERVYLFFGMRRGGDAYYALDVTNPAAPALLWRRGSTTLPSSVLPAVPLLGAGQSWSSATPARMSINTPSQSASKLVVVLGGGYDASQDNVTSAVDDSGNAIYIVDAQNGNLLWRGGRDIGADERFAATGKAMDYSIPADIKVLDFDGDGFADRMYAADMGGQIWRFDVHNGETPSNLIAGGVIAQLGAAQSPDAPEPDPVEDVRRFYYAPDVALASLPDRNFIHIGIGSGHRAHPLGKGTHDRFYALRDNDALRQLDESDYAAYVPITEAELATVTSVNTVVTNDQKGWKLDLDAAGGEKVLAEARTFNNQVFFTTFTPNSDDADQCAPRNGTNRIYVMNVLNGAPVMNLDRPTVPGPLTAADISKTVSGSILSQVVFLFPSPTGDPSRPCTGDDCNPGVVACVDLFCMPAGFGNDPIRTVWRQENIE